MQMRDGNSDNIKKGKGAGEEELNRANKEGEGE